MVENTREWRHKAYVEEERSIRDMSKECGIPSSTLRRALIKEGIVLRDKSAAQAVALKEGRAQHPTLGKKRSAKVKEKISEKRAEAWKNLSPEDLEKFKERARKQWSDMSDEDKEELLRLAREAVRETSKDGSRIEKYVRDGLTKAGFKVDYHREDLIPNEKMQLDIFLPEIGTAVEIDGPAHFLPVWGEEKLAHSIQADIEKTGLLLAQGMVIVRVKFLKRYVTAKLERDVLKAILSCLEKIRKKKPPKHERFIEIEV